MGQEDSQATFGAADFAARVGLYQVEYGLRPLSPVKAVRLEALLGVKPGVYTMAERRGCPALGEAARRVLRELEAGRRHDEKFWRLVNSLRFDSWGLELTGVSLESVGCSLSAACGKTGRDTGREAYPAFLLEHQGAALAWFPQRCVRTSRGYRWPDSIVVVDRYGVQRTLVVELDGPAYHLSRAAEERRDAELGLPVLHVHPGVLQKEGGAADSRLGGAKVADAGGRLLTAPGQDLIGLPRKMGPGGRAR